jgi:hypothetical protein
MEYQSLICHAFRDIFGQNRDILENIKDDVLDVVFLLTDEIELNYGW